MFVTPLDEWDVLEFKPNGCKSGESGLVRFSKLGKIDGIKICLLAVFLGSGLPQTTAMDRASE